MMHPFDLLNRSEAGAIDGHFEAFTSDLIRVTSVGFVNVDKLATARDANVVLFTFSLAILTDMSRSAFRTLHRRFP